jgi:branched-subunit amino acid aminotransferase/4-amino-4-deoxychorismate lyase
LPPADPLRRAYAYVNGKVTPASRAVISIFDRGLVLGDGLFETLRVREGQSEFLDLHYRRLVKSARRLRLQVPVSETALRSILSGLCRQSRLNDAVARITLTRGRYLGGLSIDPSVPPTLIATVMPVSLPSPALYARGVKVAISGINKAAASGLDPGIKSTNYLANIFARADADKKGCYEAILLGPRGEIAELSTSSFFCVLDGIITTPPIDTGILPGITRQVLLREMRRKKIPFRQDDVYPADIRRMTEAFLSSSVRGLVPITKIEKEKISDGKVGPIFQKLREIYVAACEREIQRALATVER